MRCCTFRAETLLHCTTRCRWSRTASVSAECQEAGPAVQVVQKIVEIRRFSINDADEPEARVLMGSDSRARLAETRGPRDESPSSNLGRGKQGQAIRVDCTNPQDDSGTGVATRRGIQSSLRRWCPRPPRRRIKQRTWQRSRCRM